MAEIKLPDFGENVAEGGVLELRVKEGDTINKGDVLLVVEAEKSTLEVPAEVSGRVSKLSVKKGDTVKSGQVIGAVEDGAPAGKKAEAPGKGGRDQTPERESPAVTKAREPEETEPAEQAKETAAALGTKPAPEGDGGPARNGEHGPAPARDDSKLVPAGPATRRLASKLGVDLASVTGSGPRGRVTQDDVIAYSKRSGAVGGGTGVA